MCGIVGMVATARSAEAEQCVRAATAALAHRGPDAEGAYADDLACLGHRRLSIIDVCDRANQPMRAASGDAVIVFNGEIYNFHELREWLSSRGERFHTESDTEVLFRLVALEGPAALSRVSGMFAFALWNRRTRELVLARDRFGEKPLFLAEHRGTLAFASELAALVELPGVARRIDAQALGYFLESGFVPSPLTMFEGVRAVEPGQWVRWREGEVTAGRYHDIDYRPDPGLRDPDAAKHAVLEALRGAVRRQMIADVPLGGFLSGGIDSSSVVALMQEHSRRPVQTFNVRFEDAAYDESPIARRVAEHLGTDHHELTVTDSSFKDDDLWRIVRHVGMPFADSSAIPTYVVSRHARTYVKVALSGDGGDEMFAGYPAFNWADRLARLARWPRPALRIAARASAVATRTPGLGASGAVRQARKALEYATLAGDARRFRALHWLFAPRDRAAVLAPELTAAASRRDPDLFLDLPPSAAAWTPLRRRMFARIRHELAGDMLVKVDRMSMAASLEVRAPFLDAAVAEVSSRLPDDLLIRGGQGKFILREAVRPLLPTEVFTHPKWGFSIPLHRFVNARFREVATELLAPRGPLEGLVQPRAAARVLERGLRQQADAAEISVYQATHQLWALMQLAAWRQAFRIP